MIRSWHYEFPLIVKKLRILFWTEFSYACWSNKYIHCTSKVLPRWDYHCKMIYTIMYGLEWRIVDELTRGLFWWFSKYQSNTPRQVGVHEASLRVLLVLEILCSSTFALMLNAWCVFRLFGCALSVYHLRSYWLIVRLLWVYVVIEHTVNSKWFQISTSWTRKFPEHTLAPIRWVQSPK